MIDLTKIDKPFGELDQATQWALRGACEDGAEIYVWHSDRQEFAAPLNSGLPFRAWNIYRLKPEPVKQTVSFEMGVSAYPNSAPLISEHHTEGEGWQHGTATVHLTDGKATRIVWEPSE